ncbi:MAG: MFS transporter, partial [Burkholderiales bacterium]
MLALRLRALVPVLLAVGLSVSVVGSLGAPLLPSMAVDLHASASSVQWALTATVLVGAVASPLTGRLADGPHRTTVIVTCLACVVLGGVVAALADSVATLVAGRAMQGMGLAVMPLTMAAARAHLPESRSPRVIAALSVAGAAGVGLGYPITGLVAERFDVAGAFWFGALLSAVAFALAFLLPRPERATSVARPDLAGAALIGAAVVMILLGLEKAPDWGWLAQRTLAFESVGVALVGTWIWHELRVPNPLVDLRLLRHRAVMTANV